MKTGAIKINIGCGKTALDGWINFDNSYGVILAGKPQLARALTKLGVVKEHWWKGWENKDIRRADIRDGLPFRDGEVDFIYTSHVIEHLSPAGGAKLLAECRRVLKPAGLLRVVTPDLEHLIHMHASLKSEFDRDNPTTNAPGDHFMRCLMIVEDDTRSSNTRLMSLLTRDKVWHKWIYDYDSLYAALKRNGFTSIKRVSAGIGEIADLADLEKDYPYPESLFIEAT